MTRVGLESRRGQGGRRCRSVFDLWRALRSASRCGRPSGSSLRFARCDRAVADCKRGVRQVQLRVRTAGVSDAQRAQRGDERPRRGHRAGQLGVDRGRARRTRIRSVGPRRDDCRGPHDHGHGLGQPGKAHGHQGDPCGLRVRAEQRYQRRLLNERAGDRSDGDRARAGRGTTRLRPQAHRPDEVLSGFATNSDPSPTAAYMLCQRAVRALSALSDRVQT
jgi:hypothetical protein